jgi:transcriptional regulator with XRE-family HTH domain
MPPKDTTETDQILGARIASMRQAKGFSQTDLGTALGVSFQQVQKYEKGMNRVSAVRLQIVAKFLDVPVAMLFSDDTETEEQAGAFGFLNLPGAVELLKAFAEIEDQQLRREVLVVVRSAARMRTGPAARNA